MHLEHFTIECLKLPLKYFQFTAFLCINNQIPEKPSQLLLACPVYFFFIPTSIQEFKYFAECNERILYAFMQNKILIFIAALKRSFVTAIY